MQKLDTLGPQFLPPVPLHLWQQEQVTCFMQSQLHSQAIFTQFGQQYDTLQATCHLIRSQNTSIKNITYSHRQVMRTHASK